MRFNLNVSTISWGLSMLLFLGTAASAGAGAQQPTPKTYNVLIKDFKFVPDKLEVNIGDVIVWHNKDIVPHIVTADRSKSHNLDPSESWLYTAKQKGDFPYNCRYHPTMTAELIVH